MSGAVNNNREKRLPRLLFAAPGSGSGKTLLTCGFLEVLKRRGLKPHSFKCGPDYIDPMFHRYVLGVPGGNLDSFFLSEEPLRRELRRVLDNEQEDGSIAVLEGVMGYYDGLGGILTAASSYEVACLTETPVILVVDAKGASLSLAALVKGFCSFREDSRIKGIILNRLSPMLFDRLGPAILKECAVPVLGYLPENTRYCLNSRHLGLFLPDEIKNLRQTIEKLAGQLEKTLDIDAMLEIAERESGSLERCTEATDGRESGMKRPKKTGGIRIGVARDAAFCFYYQENLRLMEEMGAELVYFSPLKDTCLPERISGLLLGGGYPENYAKELSKNSAMLASIRLSVLSGIPLLAECGGFLYLHRSLESSGGEEYPMAGVLDSKAYRTARLSRFGYVTLELPGGRTIKGHEFHYWESEDPGEDWLARKPAGGRAWPCMYQREGQIFGFPHLYYPSNPSFLEDWLLRCSQWTQEQEA